MPAPMIVMSKEFMEAGAESEWKAVSEGIVRGKMQHRVSGNPGPACDAWQHTIVFCGFDGAFEDSAENALLPPCIAGKQFAVGEKAGHLRAGSRAAWGAVKRSAWAQNEVAR